MNREGSLQIDAGRRAGRSRADANAGNGAGVLLRIVAPHFVAGIELEDDFGGELGGRCAPIVRYMRGWTEAAIRAYCARKRWQVDRVA